MTDVRQTIGSSFDTRTNGLNPIRLLLATSVVVSHSWLISGVGMEPELGGLTVGRWAVTGFFIISGFLITASRTKNAPLRFFAARAARILPGYVVALVLTAFVIAPASCLMTGNAYRAGDALTYFVRNLLLYPPYLFQSDIAETLHGLPRPDAWMGPAWTLFWEATCYFLISVAVSLLPAARLRAALTVLLVGQMVLLGLGQVSMIRLPGLLVGTLPLFMAFTVGSLIFLYRAFVPFGTKTFVLAVAVLLLVVMTNTTALLAPIPLAIVLFKLAAVRPLVRIKLRNDISYGVYIYGCQAQQILAAAVVSYHLGIGLGAFACLSVLGAMAFGAMSWWCVEKPVLDWHRRSQRDRVPVGVPAGGQSRAGGLPTA